MKNTFKLLFYIFIILVLTGCASSYRKPYVENNRYINEKYSFSFDLPEDWSLSSKLPEWTKLLPQEYKRSIKAILSSKKNKGIILLSFEKTFLDIETFKYGMSCNPYRNGRSCGAIAEGFYRGIENVYRKLEKEELQKEYVKTFEYYVTGASVNSSPPTIAWLHTTQDIDFIALERELNTLHYGCGDGDSCLATITLLSEKSKFKGIYDDYMFIINQIH